MANVVPADVAANHAGPIDDGAQHFLGERVLAEESMAPVAEVSVMQPRLSPWKSVVCRFCT
jgi:hypothetical protein